MDAARGNWGLVRLADIRTGWRDPSPRPSRQISIFIDGQVVQDRVHRRWEIEDERRKSRGGNQGGLRRAARRGLKGGSGCDSKCGGGRGG